MPPGTSSTSPGAPTSSRPTTSIGPPRAQRLRPSPDRRCVLEARWSGGLLGPKQGRCHREPVGTDEVLLEGGLHPFLTNRNQQSRLGGERRRRPRGGAGAPPATPRGGGEAGLRPELPEGWARSGRGTTRVSGGLRLGLPTGRVLLKYVWRSPSGRAGMRPARRPCVLAGFCLLFLLHCCVHSSLPFNRALPTRSAF